MSSKKKRIKKQIKKGEKTSKKSQKASAFYSVQIAIVSAFALSLGWALFPKSPAIVQKSSAAERFPVANHVVHREGYSFAYDAKNRIPLWVFEHLTPAASKKMKSFKFTEDLVVAKHLRASLKDYKKSGFCAGGLCSYKEKAKDQVYLTSAIPQDPWLSKGYWLKLENSIQQLTNHYASVDVVTGGLFIPSEAADGNRYVNYRVIGENDVAVPTHFYKVILGQDDEGNKEITAYIIPNEPIALDTPISQFRTSIETVEKYSGLTF